MKSRKRKIADEVIENLTVTPDSEASYLYEIRFTSTDKNDAPTIVNNLLQTYEDALIQQYTGPIRANSSTSFANIEDNFKNRFDCCDQAQRQQWEEQVFGSKI